MRKVIPSVRHERALPKFERKGFAMSLRLYTGVMLGKHCRIVPDAYHFDHDRHVLTLYEVEVTHFVSEDADKLDKLRLIRDFLSTLGWRLRVRIATTDAFYRPMDWETGKPKISSAELRRAVNSLGGRR